MGFRVGCRRTWLDTAQRVLGGFRMIVLNFIAVVVGAALAGSANAEPATGTRLGDRLRDGYVMTEMEAAAAGQLMSNCMVDHQVAQVRSYLSATTQAEQKASGFGHQAELDCMNMVMTNELSDTRQVIFPPDVFRGQLAQSELSHLQPAVSALAALALQKVYARPWFAMTSRNVLVDEMATCVAETNPAGVAALLKTASYAPSEGTAVKALVPNISVCLRAKATLQANRQALRAALAEALFQRVAAPDEKRAPSVGQ